jgi:PAS domain-containing protein
MTNRVKKEMLENLYAYIKNEDEREKDCYERCFLILDIIFRNLGIAIYLFNSRLKTLYANERFIKITGMSWEELRDMDCDRLCSRIFQNSVKIGRLRKKLIDKGIPFETYIRIEDGRGETELCRLTNSPLNLQTDSGEELFIGELSRTGCHIEDDEDFRNLQSENCYLRHEIFLKKFSPRETDVVMNMFYNTCEPKELAEIMHLSINTIRTHINNIKTKLEINNLFDLGKIFSENLLPKEKIFIPGKQNNPLRPNLTSNSKIKS